MQPFSTRHSLTFVLSSYNSICDLIHIIRIENLRNCRYQASPWLVNHRQSDVMNDKKLHFPQPAHPRPPRSSHPYLWIYCATGCYIWNLSSRRRNGFRFSAFSCAARTRRTRRRRPVSLCTRRPLGRCIRPRIPCAPLSRRISEHCTYYTVDGGPSSRYRIYYIASRPR